VSPCCRSARVEQVIGRVHRDDHKGVCSSRSCAHCDCQRCRWLEMQRVHRTMDAEIAAEEAES
jgi:hypothetical protein